MSTSEQQPRRARGRAIIWSDDDIERMSEITPEDIEMAKIAWRRDAPRGWAGLLDAKTDER